MGEKLRFTKMHGCGNDYIYIDCMDGSIPENPGALSVRLSDRHFGIGGDGLVLLCPSGVADVRMRMFNADGSEGRMCGNAARCVCKHIYNRKTVENFPLKIETLAGIRTAEMLPDGRVRVEMGRPEWLPERIPVSLEGERILRRNVTVGGEMREISCVSMGNPHCVLLTENPEEIDVRSIGSAIERDALFPEQVNVELVQILSPERIRMRVWERGSGETLACGTGACAAAMVCIEAGLCRADAEITVELLGGTLQISCRDGSVYMTGEAVEVFSGEIEL